MRKFRFMVICVLLMFCSGAAKAANESDEDKETLNKNEVYLMLSSHAYSLEEKKHTYVLEGKKCSDSYVEEAFPKDCQHVYADFWVSGKGWFVEEYKDDSSTGFTAAIYRNEDEKKYIIAFAGTTGGERDMADWSQNFQLLDYNSKEGQFAQAGVVIEAYKAIVDKKNKAIADKKKYAIELTGHSLGGALAQFGALEFGLKAVTFNTAPMSISEKVISYYSKDGLERVKSFSNHHITNIRSKNDYVSQVAIDVNQTLEDNSLEVSSLEDSSFYIRAVNGKVVTLDSFFSGHTISGMVRQYKPEWEQHFKQGVLIDALATAYRFYSMHVDKDKNLIINATSAAGERLLEINTGAKTSIDLEDTRILENLAIIIGETMTNGAIDFAASHLSRDS